MECMAIKYVSVPHSFHNELYRVVWLEVLKFYSRTFTYSQMLQHVRQQIVTDVSEECTASNLWVKKSKKVLDL